MSALFLCPRSGTVDWEFIEVSLAKLQIDKLEADLIVSRQSNSTERYNSTIIDDCICIVILHKVPYSMPLIHTPLYMVAQ